MSQSAGGASGGGLADLAVDDEAQDRVGWQQRCLRQREHDLQELAIDTANMLGQELAADGALGHGRGVRRHHRPEPGADRAENGSLIAGEAEDTAPGADKFDIGDTISRTRPR